MPARKLTLESGQQLPVQHREYKIDKAKVDTEKRTVEILFSTDEPAERWFGDEILDHSPGACDLSRLNDGAAFLKDHDSRLQIGVHESATISLTMGATQRGEGRAIVRFAPKTNALAEQEFQDMLAGVRTKISVGYAAHEMKLVEEDDDGNETWLVTKWEPLENSLVAIPLDKNCAAGRSADANDKFPVTLIREKNSQTREKDVDKPPVKSQKRETTTHMAENEKPVETEKERKQRERDEADAARDRNEKIQEGVKAARERETEIRAIAKRASVPEEKKGEFERALSNAVEKSITDENAVGDFRTFVFENFFGKAEVVDTPAASGGSDVKGGGKRGLTIGEQFVKSESFTKGIARRGQGERVASIEVDFSGIGIRGKVEMAVRAQRAFASADLAPVNIQIQTGIIGLGMNRLTIMDLLADGQTGAAAIIYPLENSFGSVDGVAVAAGAMPRAKAVGERGLKPIWEPDLTTATANVKKVAITTKVPDEFLADFPAARSYIDNRLPFMVDTETEFQLLYGDGLGNNLKGIFSNAGVQTRAIDTTNDRTVADSLKKGLTDIEVNSFFEPDAYAFHPYDWETASLLKDSQGRYLMGGPFYIPYGAGVFMELYTFWGKPVVKTTAVTYGRPLAGCFKLGAQYFLREGMRIEMTNANEDDFRRNLIMLRAEHRLALATYRPITFLEFTGFPART